ncbi:hypothetical protein [Corynebacterium anserum]|uniref:Uncharacterized protein n=1 Tax=Corynebacterium anserum TaxID=2684406 RepID=A0A7G7YQG6_9CORY|nr:hypothetical protein [Corynebacterium anserum]MBC2682422.1 hypothetical protein [Corynebacterium anserum]QNH96736.1 hypothetical protein GP473_08810 [Corynebacterium anserum]
MYDSSGIAFVEGAGNPINRPITSITSTGHSLNDEAVTSCVVPVVAASVKN